MIHFSDSLALCYTPNSWTFLFGFQRSPYGFSYSFYFLCFCLYYRKKNDPWKQQYIED